MGRHKGQGGHICWTNNSARYSQVPHPSSPGHRGSPPHSLQSGLLNRLQPKPQHHPVACKDGGGGLTVAGATSVASSTALPSLIPEVTSR